MTPQESAINAVKMLRTDILGDTFLFLNLPQRIAISQIFERAEGDINQFFAEFNDMPDTKVVKLIPKNARKS